MIITVVFAVLHLCVKILSVDSENFPYSGMLGGSIPPLGCRWYFCVVSRVMSGTRKSCKRQGNLACRLQTKQSFGPMGTKAR